MIMIPRYAVQYSYRSSPSYFYNGGEYVERELAYDAAIFLAGGDRLEIEGPLHTVRLMEIRGSSLLAVEAWTHLTQGDGHVYRA